MGSFTIDRLRDRMFTSPQVAGAISATGTALVCLLSPGADIGAGPADGADLINRRGSPGSFAIRRWSTTMVGSSRLMGADFPIQPRLRQLLLPLRVPISTSPMPATAPPGNTFIGQPRNATILLARSFQGWKSGAIPSSRKHRRDPDGGAALRHSRRLRHESQHQSGPCMIPESVGVAHVAARGINRGHHRGASRGTESRRSSSLSAPGLAIGNPRYQRQRGPA
jgi:hypothetical protein